MCHLRTMATETQAKGALRLLPEAPEPTVTIELPLSAIVEALATSPALLDAVAERVAARLEQPAAEDAKQSEWPERMTAAQAASYLNYSVPYIYELTSKDKLIALKAGRSRKSRSLYERSELDRYLNRPDYERRQARRERYEAELAVLPLAR
jgi:excisionase family DNA binding protein